MAVFVWVRSHLDMKVTHKNINTMREKIERLAREGSQYNSFLAKVRGKFKEPQQLNAYVENVITFVTKDDSRSSGLLESVCEGLFYIKDNDSLTPWGIDDIQFFYLGSEEDFYEQNGFPLPTVEAIVFLFEHKNIRVPILTMYDFLYKEGFVPFVMNGYVYDKSLLEFIVTYGYSKYMEWVSEEVGSKLDSEQARNIKRLTAMCDMFRGVSEDIAMNLADHCVNHLTIGKEVRYGE